MAFTPDNKTLARQRQSPQVVGHIQFHELMSFEGPSEEMRALACLTANPLQPGAMTTSFGLETNHDTDLTCVCPKKSIFNLAGSVAASDGMR